MYQDLPDRIESRVGDSPLHRRRKHRKHRKHRMMMMDEMVDMGMGRKGESPYLALVMWLGLYREDFPWLYDIAYQIYQADESDEHVKVDQLTKSLIRTTEVMRRNPMFEEFYHSKEHYILIHELPRMLDKIVMRLRKYRRKPDRDRKAEQDGASQH